MNYQSIHHGAKEMTGGRRSSVGVGATQAAFVLLLVRAAFGQSVIYVDAGAEGPNTGANWTDAYTDLQEALSSAYPNDEIWVAAGLYTPSDTDATASFVLAPDGFRTCNDRPKPALVISTSRWKNPDLNSVSILIRLPRPFLRLWSGCVNYNLVDEEWIPVLRVDGTFKRVGIHKALTEAGRIRQIAASNPMDNVALLRFLLAVLLWCKDDAKSAFATLSGGSKGIPEDWLAKLKKHRTAFNLLGDDARFYQDASLQDASLKNRKPRPIADLLVEFPGEDSVNHMRHVVHDSYGLCPACCALGILRLSVWAPANNHYPASVNPGSAAYAMAERENLLLTLAANLPEASAQADQAPWLLSTPPDSPDAVANLAWRPRKLWLKNVASEQGSCANCGSPGMLVKRLGNEGGWPTPTTDGQKFAKAVEAEFKKLGYNAKGTDQASKYVKNAVKNAPVIRMCRLDELRKACDANNPPLTAAAQTTEAAEHKIARMFHELISKNDEQAIKALTKKATTDEQNQLGDGDTKTKKFWDADPHLLRDAEAISLPGLSSDAAAHSSKFWRDALRLLGARTGKIVAIGPVVNKFIFQDATSVGLPNTSAQARAKLSDDCNDKLRGLLKQVTPNPGRQHPEINAALVLLTPDTEARIRAMLKEPDATTDDTKFLRETYEPLVVQVVASTARGSQLRRREATGRAQWELHAALRKLSQRKKQGGI